MKSSYFLTCGYYVLSDVIAEHQFRAGRIETTSGTPHIGQSIEKSIAYIEEVYEDYKTYARVARFGGRVAEVGPGDSRGVGMLFLGEGCEQVDLVDRFYSVRDTSQQARVYRALLACHPALAARFGQLDLCDENAFTGLCRRYGALASAEEFFFDYGPYDAIVSRAVFEHLYDPERALEGMARALAPGGVLLHKVDLRDHGMFSEAFHELKFLEVPGRLYRRMTRASGKPNRVLIDRYRTAMERAGLACELLVTRLGARWSIWKNAHFRPIWGVRFLLPAPRSSILGHPGRSSFEPTNYSNGLLVGIGDVVPHLPWEELPEAMRRDSRSPRCAVRDLASPLSSPTSPTRICAWPDCSCGAARAGARLRA